MPSYINGLDASLITGLGQIGVGGSTSTPIVYPTGGLIANSGFFSNNDTTIGSVSGQSGSQPPWYNRPNFGAGASANSVWTKIVGHTNSTIYCLSSSGELYSAGALYTYTGRTSVGFVPGRLDKVIAVTPTSSWTDITLAQAYVVGINNGYLWGTGAPTNGGYGSGSAAYSDFGTWRQISTNQGWIRVEAGQDHTCFMSGSGGSGSVWISGTNSNGRTGMNTQTGTTNNRAQPFGLTGSIFTDMAAGPANTFLISSSRIFGVGANTQYQLGDGTAVLRLAFGNPVATGSTYTSVYSYIAHTKAITSESYHVHTGNLANSRGDGSSTQLTTWTRINTTGDLATGWQKFYGSNNFNNMEGTIGINNNRPYYIKQNAYSYSAIFPKTTVPYQSASYQFPLTAVSTWVPFISGGYDMNITCSAVGFTTYNSSTNPYQPAMWMYLTPQ